MSALALRFTPKPRPLAALGVLAAAFGFAASGVAAMWSPRWPETVTRRGASATDLVAALELQRLAPPSAEAPLAAKDLDAGRLGPPLAEDLSILAPSPAASAPSPAGVRTAALRPASELSKPVRVTARSGDTLVELLREAGAARREAALAIDALDEIWSPRRLRPGMDIDLDWSEGDGGDLARVVVRATPFERAVVERDQSDAFVAELRPEPTEWRSLRVAGEIQSSLFASLARAGLDDRAIGELVKLLSFDVDFQRDVHRGDAFEVVIDGEHALEGAGSRNEILRFVRLALRDRTIVAYAFERDGSIEFFDADGRSVRRALLATPIDGARISSGFGMRRHPISGFRKKHTGVDFAAPTGTPVFAAGDGRVDRIGRNGGYGEYVRIRHNGEFSTAYAHLSRYADGLDRGDRVEQGEVIGYVGSTGASTGPHLHYEVIRNGEKVDPKSVRRHVAEHLQGADLERFRAARDEVDRLRRTLANGVAVARR